jgi:tetratricopeptide (TPR) repeat protein
LEDLEIEDRRTRAGDERRSAVFIFTDPTYLNGKKMKDIDAFPRRVYPVGDLVIPIDSEQYFSFLKRRSVADNIRTFRYERPAFEYDRTLFTNLVQYAPGLHNTRADILATLEREAEIAPTPLGKIDADARKLIEKARSAEWFTLTVPAEGPLPSYQVHYNGVGQFTYERLLSSGLIEQVICDGQMLWHLYAEIGLAAKRPMSGHHQHVMTSIAPAFLPVPEELARGHEVKAIDASMVALIPLEGDKKHHVHLVFAKDGTLSERRLVAMPKAEVVARQVFLKGSVEWRDAKDKLLASQTRVVTPAKAPSLQPRTDHLVVMQMPIRTMAHILDIARKLGRDPDTHPDIVLERLVAYCFDGGGNDKWIFPLAKHLAQAKDRRLGLVTLLSAGDVHNIPLTGLDAMADPSALGQYLSQSQRLIPNDSQEPFKLLPGPKDGFLQRLARYRNLWLAWHNQTVSRDAAGLPLEKAKVLEFLQDTPSPLFTYAILDTMQRRAGTAPTEQMLNIAVHRIGPISDPGGLGYVFRYEHARSLYQAGNGVEAGKAFRKLHADTLAFDVLPPIDAGFREALQMPLGAGPRFVGFTRKTLDDLISKKHYGLAFQLAKQLEQLGDDAFSDEILAIILARADDKERNALTLVAIQFFIHRQNFVHADRLVRQLLEDKNLANSSELWHWRCELTKRLGQTASSVACLEKALDLEYADLPELIDLERVRSDYRALLSQYQTLAESLATLKAPMPKELLAKVIRSADRWRLLDGESAEPCMMAGKIFHTLGLDDLAWDYWTTPIDLHPAESKPWLDLAETLKSAGALDRADRAYVLAFEAEPTNPEILWKRAQNLVQQGQGERARELYRRIAEGQWQERFNGTVEQARGLATP